ncbi:transposable element Tcb2 transposase [Trichonephila clavipes]|nr:transposable element Tcb2 transposase [Trichonephila clavipes]
MSRKSPFIIHKALIGIGGEPKSIKKLRSGDLLIETISAVQSKSFLLVKTFMDSPLVVTPHRTLNSCRGVISESDLLCASETEILEGLSDQGVTQDEVEKLAYQLNEEAERTERPIRRLSKEMYGSTYADMQVDVMGECLSSIKHVVGREMANNQSVRRHLDAFTRGRIIGKLEEGRSVTSVAAEFGIAHSIVSRLWRQFQTTGTAIRGFSSDRP